MPIPLSSIARHSKALLAAATLIASQVVTTPAALAGASILNGTECVPFVGFAPTATTPNVFPYGNKLDIHRNGSDWNLIVSCNFTWHTNGSAISSGNVSLAIVDGRSLNSVRLCYGSYYSDSFSCGASVGGAGPAYFVYPPSPRPASATAPFLLISSTVTTANTPIRVRSYTGYWSAP